MGINFGGYQFGAPQSLPSGYWGWMTPQSLTMPGIYAILEADTRWSPKPYRVLYFGESSNVLRRATGAHERFSSWRATAGHAKPLYRALCPMPGSTKYQRQQVENLLIRKYGPPCNGR